MNFYTISLHIFTFNSHSRNRTLCCNDVPEGANRKLQYSVGNSHVRLKITNEEICAYITFKKMNKSPHLQPVAKRSNKQQKPVRLFRNTSMLKQLLKAWLKIYKCASIYSKETMKHL